jgi:aromatic-L-amino-acid/L-tryptophan decarboxylase
MSDVDEFIMPGMTHWQHPSFFAYFSANSSFPGILGEMMSGMFNVIGFNWICSPACTELETIVLDWLAKALKLPESFLSQGKGGGVIQGTASEATLVALLAAKSKALNEKKEFEKLVVYCSDQAHSSIRKACMIAGITDKMIRMIEGNDKFELDPNTLQKYIDVRGIIF